MKQKKFNKYERNKKKLRSPKLKKKNNLAENYRLSDNVVFFCIFFPPPIEGHT